MIRKLLTDAVNSLPKPVQLRIRDRYWRTKSRLLYQSLYKWMGLENTLRSGITLQVASKGEWWVYNDIFVNGEYDVPILQCLQTCSPLRPLTVLDLGANVGYFTLRVVDLIRQTRPEQRVDATMVEASPRVFGELETRMRSQILPEASLRMEQGLVGMRTGSASLRESAVHVKNTIMSGGTRDGRNIPFIDIDVLMEHAGEIDLLKCDIEGAELLFLENYPSLLGKVRNAVFELHHEMCDTGKCREILRRNGFRETVLRSTTAFSVNLLTRDEPQQARV
jgi:FkbM family methyltransferase